MKQVLLSFVGILLTLAIMAQAPEGLNYQAVARDGNGSLLTNTGVTVRFTLHSGSPTGAVAYAETHATSTNDFGLFSLVIGSGSATQGTFNNINWGGFAFFLQVEMDAGSGYVDLGTTQLMSVPYALYAKEAGNGGVTYTAGSGIDINGTTITNTGDTNPNDDITSGSSAGGDLNGAYPNPVVDGLQGRGVSSAAPANGDVLKWNGTNWAPAADATGTGGTSVWSTSGTTAYYSAGRVGIGTSSPDEKLHVTNGDVLISGTQNFFSIDNTTNSGYRFYQNNIFKGALFFNDVNDAVNISRGYPTPGVVVNNNNQVGIGTFSPTNALSVNGTSDFTGNMEVTGNIDLSGRISFGSIEFFEDGGASQIASGGSLRPTSSFYNIGTVNDPWNNGYFSGNIKVGATTSTPAANTLYGNALPLAYANILLSGSIRTEYGIASVTRTSTGVYTIVLDNAWSGSPAVMITPFNNTPAAEIATYATSGNNTIIVNIANGSGTATSSDFSIVIFGTAQ